MVWTTVIWSMSVSACLTLALVHILSWATRSKEIVHLLFALTAVGVAAMSGRRSLSNEHSAHADRIWATNNPDRGACFHVFLSAVSEEAYV